MRLPFPRRHLLARRAALAAIVLLAATYAAVEARRSASDISVPRLLGGRRNVLVELHPGRTLRYLVGDRAREIRILVLHVSGMPLPTARVALRAPGLDPPALHLALSPAPEGSVVYAARRPVHGQRVLRHARVLRLDVPPGRERQLLIRAGAGDPACALLRVLEVSRRTRRQVAGAVRRRGEEIGARLARLDALQGESITPSVLRRRLRLALVPLAPEGDPGADFEVVEATREELRPPETLHEAPPATPLFVVRAYVPVPATEGRPLLLPGRDPVRLRARVMESEQDIAPEMEVTFRDARGNVEARRRVTVCPPPGPWGRVRGDERPVSSPSTLWAMPAPDVAGIEITGDARLRVDAAIAAEGRMAPLSPQGASELDLLGRVVRLEIPPGGASLPTSRAELPAEPVLALGLPRRVWLLERQDGAHPGSEATYGRFTSGKLTLADTRPLADPEEGAELCYGNRGREGQVELRAEGMRVATFHAPAGSGRLRIPGRVPAARNLSVSGVAPSEIWLVNRRSAGPLWVRRPAFLLPAQKELHLLVPRRGDEAVRLQLRVYPELPSTEGMVDLEPVSSARTNVLTASATALGRSFPLAGAGVEGAFVIGGRGAPLSTPDRIGITLGHDLDPGPQRVVVRFRGSGQVVVRTLSRAGSNQTP